MPFDLGQFALIGHHAQIMALEVMIGDMPGPVSDSPIRPPLTIANIDEHIDIVSTIGKLIQGVPVP
jgi:hypothetical protein